MLKDLIRKIVKGTLTAARTSGGEFLLRKTDFGLVHVEYAVIQKISARAVAQVKGIHDADVIVEKTANSVTPFKISMTLTLDEGFSAPRTREEISTAINDALRNSLQLMFYVPVEVKVNQITKAVPPTRRRVR